MKEKFGWRVRKTVQGVNPQSRKTIQLNATNVGSVAWINVKHKEYQLKVEMKDGEILRFDGFRIEDHQGLKKHIEQYWMKQLATEKLSTRGWHCGSIDVKPRSFRFSVNNETAFEIPSSFISQINATKSNINIIFDNDEKRLGAEDHLLEMRFAIPTKVDEQQLNNLLQKLKNLPTSLSGQISQTICTFEDLKLLLPAGRFDIKFTKVSLQLNGKSSDFTINYTNISQILLLPWTTTPHVNIVLPLKNPLTKGNTSYNHAIIQFDARKVVTKTLEFDDSSVFDSATDIEKEMTAEEFNIAIKLLKFFTKLPCIEPTEFKSNSGACCFRASFKADSGNFYPLEKFFIYIPKPVITIPYAELQYIALNRTTGAQTRLFEFDIIMNSGYTYSFSSVDRQEINTFLEYLTKKCIVVKSLAEISKDSSSFHLDKGELLSDDESDEDYNDEINDDEDDEEEEEDEDEEDEDDEEDNEEDEASISETKPKLKKARKR